MWHSCNLWGLGCFIIEMCPVSSWHCTRQPLTHFSVYFSHLINCKLALYSWHKWYARPYKGPKTGQAPCGHSSVEPFFIIPRNPVSSVKLTRLMIRQRIINIKSKSVLCIYWWYWCYQQYDQVLRRYQVLSNSLYCQCHSSQHFIMSLTYVSCLNLMCTLHIFIYNILDLYETFLGYQHIIAFICVFDLLVLATMVPSLSTFTNKTEIAENYFFTTRQPQVNKFPWGIKWKQRQTARDGYRPTDTGVTYCHNWGHVTCQFLWE